MTNARTAERRVIDISVRSIVRVVAAILVVWLWLHLWQLVILVVMAAVLAVGLEPIVGWLEARRIPRGLAASGLVLTLALVAVGFLWTSGASLVSQARDLSGHVDEVRHGIAERLPGVVRQAAGQARSPVNPSAAAGYAFDAGRLVVDGVIVGILALILTIYLLLEGRQTYAWLLAYVPPAYRARVDYTAAEAREKVRGYLAGNLATSACAMIVVFSTLSLLHVPGALLVALLAGVFDFVPVVGFICSAAPALLLAATRSGGVAIAVACVYTGYHLAENYYIGPKVYGDRLRLSNLAVILAFAAGAEIGGIAGALLALPLAALYPVIERVWLRDYLARDAVETHRRLEGSRHSHA
ncbi:MAG TPA: AI-2E family transporter [Vicinamibacterales bacterium]